MGQKRKHPVPPTTSILKILLTMFNFIMIQLCLQVEDINGKPQDNPKLAMVEAICIAYFTVEFLLR